MARYSLSKAERLTGKTIIDRLNDREHNSSLHQYPFLLAWIKTEDSATVPLRVLFSVSRRKFKNATDRNRIKRLMRSLYQSRKPELLSLLQEKNCEPLALMIVYIGKDILEYPELQEKFDILIDNFQEQIKMVG